MTKGELVESVYLNVLGGKLSDDVHVQREDIAVYLSSAINFAMTEKIRMDKADSMMDGLVGGTLSTDFLGTYYAAVVKDEKRNLKYSILPVKIQALTWNSGLQDVFPTQHLDSDEFKAFKKVSGPTAFQYLGKVLGSTTVFWQEKIGSEERIYYKNINPFIEEVAVRAVASAQDLSDDDVLPIPPGMEIRIIDLCINFFRQQRHDLADYISDNKDDKQP